MDWVIAHRVDLDGQKRCLDILVVEACSESIGVPCLREVRIVCVDGCLFRDRIWDIIGDEWHWSSSRGDLPRKLGLWLSGEMAGDVCYCGAEW